MPKTHQTCEPLRTFQQDDSPVDIAEILIEDATPKSTHPQTDLIDDEISKHNPDSKIAGVLGELREVVGKGIDAARTQTALGCGTCALKQTCEVTANLTSHSLAGVEASAKVDEITIAREKTDQDKSIKQVIHRWVKSNQKLETKKNIPSQEREMNRAKQIVNETQNSFMMDLARLSPEKRDGRIKHTFESLPKEERDYVISNGLIDGVVTELYVYEQLKALEGIGAIERVELSTVDQDIKDGVDFIVTTASGQIFYLDAKLHLKPDDQPLGKRGYSYFAKKRETTRNGDTVFMVSPNSRDSQKSYIGATELGPARVASFSNTSEQSSSEFRDLLAGFIDVLDRRKLGAKPISTPQTNSLGSLPTIS